MFIYFKGEQLDVSKFKSVHMPGYKIHNIVENDGLENVSTRIPYTRIRVYIFCRLWISGQL